MSVLENLIKRPPILYEDNHIMALNKPPGILVQGDKSGDPCVLDLIKSYVKKRDKKPGRVFMGLPHRLDRPSSGVLILAKTSKALSRIAASFREHKTEKIYWVIVENQPDVPMGERIDFLCKDGKKNISQRVKRDVLGAKEARLRYRLIGGSKNSWLLEVQLLTGRHHQIRAQLSAMGCPVKGDLKYGSRWPGSQGINLHARRLKLPHPVGDKAVDILAPLPGILSWEVFRQFSERISSSIPDSLVLQNHVLQNAGKIK